MSDAIEEAIRRNWKDVQEHMENRFLSKRQREPRYCPHHGVQLDEDGECPVVTEEDDEEMVIVVNDV